MTSLQKIWGCDEEMMEISLKICVSIQMKLNTVGPKTAKPHSLWQNNLLTTAEGAEEVL